jgi:hypothetical protein
MPMYGCHERYISRCLKVLYENTSKYEGEGKRETNQLKWLFLYAFIYTYLIYIRHPI